MGVSPFADPDGVAAPAVAAPDPTKPYLPPATPNGKESGESAPSPAPTATGTAAGGTTTTGGGNVGGPVPVPVPVPTGPPPTPVPTPTPPPVGSGSPPGDENPPDNGGEVNPPDTTAENPPQPAGPATVRLVPSAPSYRVGDRVIVEVRIDGGTNVGSVPFHLRYNRAVLEFVPPAVQGPFLSADGTNTVFLANDVGGGGEIVVGLSRLGGTEGVTGSGTLATFQFQAIAGGDCGFAWTGAAVKDPQARNLPASFLTAPVSVEP